MFHKKVKERQKLKRLDTLQRVENELYLITREVELANEPIPFDQIFINHDKTTMMMAKFYAECLFQGIPCVLRPTIKIGTFDAIIEVDSRFIILEFRVHPTAQRCFAKNYRSFGIESPLIFFNDQNHIARFLREIATRSLSNSVFSYENGRFKRVRSQSKTIHRSDSKENKQVATLA